jgi:hypothetical protein
MLALKRPASAVQSRPWPPLINNLQATKSEVGCNWLHFERFCNHFSLPKMYFTVLLLTAARTRSIGLPRAAATQAPPVGRYPASSTPGCV